MDECSRAERTAETVSQLLRYAVVGIVTNLAGYLAYLALTSLGSAPKITMTVLYGVGAAIGFIGNRNLTFSYQGSFFGSGMRYLIVHCFGYCINFAILVLFVDRLGYAHEVVQGVAILVVAIFLFTAFKLFVFLDPDRSRSERQ